MARTAGRPEAIDRLLRETGPAWQQDIRAAGDRVKAAYLPLLMAAPSDGYEVIRDLPYGTHPRQVLDVYRPHGAHGAPVVMFVHGGAFVRGSKDINAAMYGNVLAWFARQGCVGINVEYRLAPEAAHPEGACDLAAACEWVARHATEHGGDADAICLVGHSAGGTHAASYACDPALGFMGRHLCGLVLVSARLQADTLPENPNAAGVRAYFGDDTAAHGHLSPMAHAHRLALPTFIVHAQYENPLLDVYATEFAWRMAEARRVAPRHLSLAGHNHVSVMAHFNSGEQWLGEQILEFFEAARR
jgi:acetyl esterase